VSFLTGAYRVFLVTSFAIVIISALNKHDELPLSTCYYHISDGSVL
jgi:hypothetical protein